MHRHRHISLVQITSLHAFAQAFSTHPRLVSEATRGASRRCPLGAPHGQHSGRCRRSLRLAVAVAHGGIAQQGSGRSFLSPRSVSSLPLALPELPLNRQHFFGVDLPASVEVTGLEG